MLCCCADTGIVLYDAVLIAAGCCTRDSFLCGELVMTSALCSWPSIISHRCCFPIEQNPLGRRTRVFILPRISNFAYQSAHSALFIINAVTAAPLHLYSLPIIPSNSPPNIMNLEMKIAFRRAPNYSVLCAARLFHGICFRANSPPLECLSFGREQRNAISLNTLYFFR